MFVKPRLSIRTANQGDRQQLASLMHFETYVHRHLDYRQPLDWVGKQPFTLLEQQNEIVAALACPPDPPQIAWIRLFATSYLLSPEKAWNTLWPEGYSQLTELESVEWIAAIPTLSWFENLLKSSNFQRTHRIVMMKWTAAAPPEWKTNPDIIIRPMSLDDLNAVQQIDQASFVPVWQNSPSYIELAYHQAMIATVAELGEEIVGYQISTATPIGGHLARLAVRPELQRHGIGLTLLHDLLSQFHQRGAQAITVNTQHDNKASNALYKKVGFKSTGEEYPIYQYQLGNKGIKHEAF